MYTKEEASAIRQEFWTTLGKYLSPVPSATGNKINWINYKTGVKNIFYKMGADKQEAIVRIDITGDEDKRKIFFELFSSLKNMGSATFLKEWIWQKETEDMNGKIIACIYCEKEGLNIFKRDDWPILIFFFKENIIAFDAFWTEYKEIFEMHS